MTCTLQLTQPFDAAACLRLTARVVKVKALTHCVSKCAAIFIRIVCEQAAHDFN